MQWKAFEWRERRRPAPKSLAPPPSRLTSMPFSRGYRLGIFLAELSLAVGLVGIITLVW